MCRSRSRTVIALRRGTRWRALRTETTTFLNSGMNFGHGVVKAEAALFVKHHHRDSRDGLGHRVDAKERSLGHRRARLQILNPDGFEICNLPASRNGRDGSGNPLFRDVAVQQIGGLAQTCGREASGFRRRARRLLPCSHGHNQKPVDSATSAQLNLRICAGFVIACQFAFECRPLAGWL